MNLKELINSPTATIVDVRTPSEFMGGHVAGSINIPLQEVPQRIEELRGMSKPLVLCCASGNRSGQATQYLAGSGIDEVYNGGGWMAVNFARSQA
jgi:phage shock protein E